MDNGLVIAGQHITGTDADFGGVLQQVLAPNAEDSDRTSIVAAADPLAVQIVEAMIGDTILHVWADAAALRENIELRRHVINEMRGISSGAFDCNYAMPGPGIFPVLGLCQNWVWYRQRRILNDVKHDRELERRMNKNWRQVGGENSFVFEAVAERLSDAISETLPFRGECQGAMQLSILRGALATLGADRIDTLAADLGTPAFVGASHVPADNLKGWRAGVYTFANRFLDYHPIPMDYVRNKRLGVPGDYFYYKNIDVYPAFSLEQGAWSGENCIYMGDDYTGRPSYSGMGEANFTEIEMNFEMINAVYHDCNLPFIQDWIDTTENGGVLKTTWPFILVRNPHELGFSLRGILRTPTPEEGDAAPSATAEPSTGQTAPAAPPDMEAHLEKLGATRDARGLWQGKSIGFADLSHALGIQDRHLRQVPSSPLFGPSYQLRLSEWLIVLHPVDPAANPWHPEAEHTLHCLRVPDGF